MLRDPARQAIGLDFSGRQLRFVRIRRRRRPEVVRFGYVPLPDGTIQHGEVTNPTALQQQLLVLQDTKVSGKPRPRGAVAAISEHHTFLKYLEVPMGPAGDVDEAIRWEATQHIPYDLKDLNLDWVVLPTPTGRTAGALVVAAPRDLVESYASAIERVGLEPLALEPASLVVVRAFAAQLPTDDPALLLLLGELESTVVLVQRRIPLFTSTVHLTTTELEQRITKQFTLPADDAQRALYALGLYKFRARGIVRDLLRESFDSLVNRLQEILDFYRNHFPAPGTVATLLICGPGARIAGLTEELTGRLKLTVSLARLPTALHPVKRASGFAANLLEYSVALGSALRRLHVSPHA